MHRLFLLFPRPQSLRNNSKAIILNSRIMDKFDLLRDLFRVNFDIYTARPHFIVLPKNTGTIQLDFSEMTPVQTRELMKTVQSMMSRYGISSATLSIHRGSWMSSVTEEFHAHICVHVNRYLHVFEQEKQSFPDWPENTNRDSYPQDVRSYPYRSYFKKEVATIKKLLGPPVPSVPLPEVNVDGITLQIRFHPSHPKIGFVGKKQKINLQKLVWAIENFAKSLGLTSFPSDDEDDGCHVCLYVGSADTADEWNFTSEEEEVLGYIVTTGPRFYQLCPVNSREDWFNAFKVSEFKCST